MAIDLEAIEARANAASEGPWKAWIDTDDGSWVSYDEGQDMFEVGGTMEPHDATFIANAREDIPALVAEVRRLRAFIAELSEDGCSYGDGCPVFGSNHGRCLACRAKDELSNA